jgi:hypothetical protein
MGILEFCGAFRLAARPGASALAGFARRAIVLVQTRFVMVVEWRVE